jgi:hypothetical protein
MKEGKQERKVRRRLLKESTAIITKKRKLK